MRRRRLLSACGTSLAVLAGCLSQGSPGGPDESGDQPTPTSQGETSTDPTTDPGSSAGSLSVSVISLQPAVVELATPDSLGVFGGGHQYLFLDLSVTDGQEPAKADLGFRFDGSTIEPMAARGLWYHYNHMEEEYSKDEGAGWLVFELPQSGDASDAALTWPNGEWQPKSSIRERLAAEAPPMSMEASIPETITPTTTPEISLTVTNEGTIDERFVAAVNRTGGGVAYAPIEAVGSMIPAGETRTIDITDTLDISHPGAEERSDGEPDLTYQVRWSGENVRQDVYIVDES